MYQLFAQRAVIVALVSLLFATAVHAEPADTGFGVGAGCESGDVVDGPGAGLPGH